MPIFKSLFNPAQKKATYQKVKKKTAITKSYLATKHVFTIHSFKNQMDDDDYNVKYKLNLIAFAFLSYQVWLTARVLDSNFTTIFIFPGEDEIFGVNQTNKTEDDNAKKWSAISILDYTFVRGHHGKSLQCIAEHEAYPTKRRHTAVLMDIQCKCSSPFYCYYIIIVDKVEWLFIFLLDIDMMDRWD